MTVSDRVICPCMNVTDRQVEQAIEGGCRTINDLKTTLQVGTKCTGCEAYLYDALETKGLAAEIVAHPAKAVSVPMKEWARRLYHVVKPPWIKMATCFVETPDLHTRINITNLQFPEGDDKWRPVPVRLAVYDPAGKQIAAHTRTVGLNQTASFEMASLLPEKDRPDHGTVRLYARTNKLRSLRFYCHWYNDHCVTATHEKFTDRSLEHGFHTLSKVYVNSDYETCFAIANLTDDAFQSSLVLLNDRGEKLAGDLRLPPRGSRFAKLTELVPGADRHLNGGLGGLYSSNTRQPSMFYYFGRNHRDNLWQVQHL